MSVPHDIVAVVFDFDGTLLPDSTTKLLAKYGIDTDKFWSQEAKGLVQQGFDPTLAYLELILDLVGPGKPLGKMTNQMLRDFGRGLDRDFYPGVPGILKDLSGAVTKTFKGIEIEFYIISSGLLPVIEGSEVVRKHFKSVYASELAEYPSGGYLKRIKQCVTFTEKTRYLFEINKGLSVENTRKEPYLVNTDVPEAKRRIPLKNMIYIGDGLTDIPCFSLLKKNGGTAFGVFQPAEVSSAKRAFLEFLKTDRVVSCHAPRYRKKDELGSLLRSAVLTRCNEIDLERQQAVRG